MPLKRPMDLFWLFINHIFWRHQFKIIIVEKKLIFIANDTEYFSAPYRTHQSTKISALLHESSLSTCNRPFSGEEIQIFKSCASSVNVFSLHANTFSYRVICPSLMDLNRSKSSTEDATFLPWMTLHAHQTRCISSQKYKTRFRQRN